MVLKLLVFLFTFSLSQEVGDECTLYNGEIGFLECNLACYPISLLENIGNGSCDDGIDCCELNCPEFDCDGGDCIGTYYESDCELFEECSDGDINNDNEVNIQDILIIVNCILEYNCDECSDLNEDSTTNVIDILIVIDIILNPPDLGVIDIDGNLYETIQVGEQLWMKENLKVTHYNNGDEILFIDNSQLWNDYNNGQYTLYNNDESNIDLHGFLYNWSAINDERGICPLGFHIPTDNEWAELISFLDEDANPNAENHDEFESMIAGGLLKGIGTIESGDGYWYEPNTGATNSIDFSALGSGVIPDENGNLESLGSYIGYLAFFWTSTEINDNLAWSRELAFINTTVHRHSLTKNYGLSVRCIQN